MSIYDKASLVQIPSGYKSGTLYSVVPNTADGDFDASRGSTATRVNKDGLIETVAANTPRLDYPLLDGVVQDCPALLLEPSRTNYVTNSEDLTGGTKSVVTATANTTDTTDPSGGNNATKFQVTASGADAYSRTQYTAALTDFSCFIYVKAAAGQKFQIFAARDSYAEIISGDLITCTGVWQKVEFSGTFSTTSSTVVFGIEFGHSATDSVSGQVYYCWGSQLEQGSYPTSYIPTSGSTVTRSADVCNGSGTSAEFNDSEGVFFVDTATIQEGVTEKIISLSDETTSNNIYFSFSGAAKTIYALVVSGGLTQASLTVNVPQVQQNKLLIKYKSNDVSFWLNGFKVGTDTIANTPSGLRNVSFSYPTNIINFYGNTKQLMTFNEALSDSELETLTSWDSFNEMAKGQLYTIE